MRKKFDRFIKKHNKFYLLPAAIGIILFIMFAPNFFGFGETESLLSYAAACSQTGGRLVATSSTTWTCDCGPGRIWTVNACQNDPTYSPAEDPAATAQEGMKTLDIILYYVVPVFMSIVFLIISILMYKTRMRK